MGKTIRVDDETYHILMEAAKRRGDMMEIASNAIKHYMKFADKQPKEEIEAIRKLLYLIDELYKSPEIQRLLHSYNIHFEKKSKE